MSSARVTDRNTLVYAAIELLRGRDGQTYMLDARHRAHMGSTIAGAALEMRHGSSRQTCEAAVREALQMIDVEA